MAAGSLVKKFSEETTCPVCLDYFTDPVITKCGHNFCRACLTQSLGDPSRNSSCPQCRKSVQPNSLRPNRQLANIVEITKKYSLQFAKWSDKVCEEHQEPLKLFCRKDEAPICVVCDRSKEHQEHQVVLIEEADEEYKKKIQDQLKSLEKKKEMLIEQKKTEMQKSQEYLKQLEAERKEIICVMEQMHTYLHEKQCCWLGQLDELEKEIKRTQGESMARLSKEISHFNDLIKDVEAKCRQPPSEFLQDIRNTLSRCQEMTAKEKMELSPGLKWKLRSYSPKSSVLNKVMKDVKGSLTQSLNKVFVTLDPDTAHPVLLLSEDLKSVTCGNSKQILPYNPERFNALPYVLGRERFTSGRHYWEVEVKEMKGGGCWAVGVARESVRRKGWICLSLAEGVYVVGKDSSHSHYVFAYTSPVPTPVARGVLKKIRVFLDYEEGCVEFFDVDTNRFIFSFPPGSFSGEGIRPFLWVQEGVCIQCCILKKTPQP